MTQFRTKTSVSWRDQVSKALAKRGHVKEAKEFGLCSDDKNIRAYKVCTVNPSHNPHPVGFTCHLRCCPDCARRESARLLSRYLPAVEKVASQQTDEMRLRFVTLTRRIWLHSKQAWIEYYRTWKCIDQVFDKVLGEGWKKSGAGYIASAEFGETGQKLHYHVLFYGPYLEQKKMVDAWKSLTGDYIVWVNAVTSVGQAVKEVLKYATKLTVQAPSDVARVFEIIKGSRRVRSVGCFYNIPEAEEPVEILCKVCHSPLELMSVSEYEAWQASQAIRPPIVGLPESLLNLITGNKSAKVDGEPDEGLVRYKINLNDLLDFLEKKEIEDKYNSK